MCLRKLLREGDVFINCGAHVGYFVLLASQLVGSNGKVLCFEPEQENYRDLVRNIGINNAKNISAFQYAISSTTKSREKLFLNPYNDGGNSLNEFCYDVPFSFQLVDKVTLDDFTNQSQNENLRLAKIDVVLIDVEGHQIDVLNGALQTIQRHLPDMIIEYTSPNHPPEVTTVNEIKELLSPFGYQFEIFCNEQSILCSSPK